MNNNSPMKSTSNNTKTIILSIFAGLICITIAAVILIFPNKSIKSESVDLSDYSSVSTICELATLKSYYHNVAMFKEEPSNFVQITTWPFNVGYKQFWIEYSGIVETGIDASQIRISGPDKNGIVEVSMPNAKVLNVYADINSLTKPLTEEGLFTSITAEEQTKAFGEAQSAMRQEAENDQALLERAKQNAKLLLERYIVNIGKEMGINLSVKWIEM